MKSLLRNLMFVTRRYKLSVALNLLGLSAAFIVVAALMLQMDYDRSYNACLPDADRIAMPYSTPVDSENENIAWTSFPLMEGIGALPHVEAYTYTMAYCHETQAVVDGHYYPAMVLECATNFADFLHLDIMVGDKRCLDASQVMISESLATKLFGSASAAIGHTIDKERRAVVGAVYRDVASRNCWFKNPVLTGINKAWFGDGVTNPNMNSFLMFLRVDKTENLAAVTTAANRLAADMGKTDPFFAQYHKSITMVPLTETHYVKDVDGLVGEHIDETDEGIMLAIALLILLIASINFANFYVALIPMRVKSINTQKILGATQSSLRLYLLIEAVAVALTAYVIAVAALQLMANSELSRLTVAGTDIMGNLKALTGMAGLAVAVGVIAGIVPAWRITSFKPAVALNGNFGLSRKGQAIRTAMIGLQFFISAALIISTVLMQRQHDYLINSADYGFAKDELIVCDLSAASIDRPQAVADAVKRLPAVADASISWSVAGQKDNTQGWVFTASDGTEVAPKTLFASADYLSTMGIKVVDGRDFCPTDSNVIILNQLARTKYRNVIDVGRKLAFGPTEYTIVGICDNAKFSSLHSSAAPVMIIKKDDPGCNILNVRVKKGTNIFDAAAKIRSELAKFNDEYPFNLRFYNQILDDTYKKETLLTRQITILAVLAIAISLMGVFGLVVFDSEYRRREIAVRRVFGASTSSIVRLFNLKYLTTLTVSFIIAVPAACCYVGRWLESFAYRTEIDWLSIALTFVALAVLTSATVTYQCWHTAKSNPVDGLRGE